MVNKDKFKSIRVKEFLFLSVLMISVFLIVDLVFYITYKHYYFENIQKQYTYMARQNFDSLEYKLNYYQTLINNLSSNKNIQEIITDFDSHPVDNGTKLTNEITPFVSILDSEEIHNLTVYPEKYNILGSPYIGNTAEVRTTEWYRKFSGGQQIFFFEETPSANLFSYVKPITVSNGNGLLSDYIAAIKLDIKQETLFSSSNNPCTTMVKNGEDKIVFSSAAPEISIPTSYDTIQNMFVCESGDYVIYYKNYYQSQISVYYMFNRAPDNSVFNTNLLLIFLFIFMMFLIMLLFILMYSRKITQKIVFISNKIKKIENGYWRVDASLEGNDEFAQIDSNLNKMTDKLNILVAEKYISEIERKNANLQALQMQINPHFLYNTLEVINKLAQGNDPDRGKKISLITQHLGEMFRYNISKNDIYTTLSAEIRHITNYLDIQNIRFDNKINTYIDISPNASSCRILKFILQPIIENSITHGLTEQIGSISVEAEVCGNNLIITVSDDGVGMSDEQTKNLNSKLLSEDVSSPSHIGLRNVTNRIRLAYGKDYGVLVESKLRVGTKVIITLPADYRSIGGTHEYFNC